MSLVIWLPLNEDLHNQGCSNVEIINNGATIDNAGKIGKCYLLNGSSSYIELNSALCSNETTEFSYACWVKFNSTASCCLFSNRTAVDSNGVTLFVNNNGNILFDIGKERHTKAYTFSTGTWYHLAFTYKKGATKKIYVNGAEIYSAGTSGTMTSAAATKSFIGASQNTSTTVNDNYLNGYLNDVRIWNDHCLSAAEVKEIAQGLVLHYKLDASSEEKITTTPSTNVYSYPTFNTSAVGGGWYHWGPSGHSGSYGQNTDKKFIYNKNNIYSHWITEDTGTGKYYLLYQSPAFEGGYRSLQAIIKEENSLPITESICYPSWNARNGGVPNNKWTSIKDLGDGFYYCRCEGISQDGSNDLVGIVVMPGYKIYVSECYLEDNIETCSPIFTYSSNIIQDSSGYGHNGEIISELHILNDTARYNNSTLFDGVDDCIIVPYNEVCPENIFTINLWFKKDALGSKNYETLFGGPSGFEMDTRAGTSTALSLYMASTRGGNAATGLQLNTWYMVTMVRDGINERYYINGELKKEIEAKAMPTGVYRIGAWASNTGQNYYGNISDFRIYCTPLLDTDIKLLYNTSMKLDNLGNCHTYELNENKTNLMWRPESARAAGKGLNSGEGLSAYTQSNCQVTCNSDGYKIYRPANLTVADNGNTMYGGLKIRNSTNGGIHIYNAAIDNIFNLQKGHTYIWIFTVNGSTEKAPSFQLTNNMGWGGGGLSPTPSNATSRGTGSNFNGTQECWYKFTINDDIVKTCTSSYSSFVQGNQYLSYMDFGFYFIYQSTGTGTNLYISNIRLYDITNIQRKLNKTGIANFTSFIEENYNNKILSDGEFYGQEFIEI